MKHRCDSVLQREYFRGYLNNFKLVWILLLNINIDCTYSSDIPADANDIF